LTYSKEVERGAKEKEQSDESGELLKERKM